MDPFFFLSHFGLALLGSVLLNPCVFVSGVVEFAGLTVMPAELRLKRVDSTAPLTVLCNVTAFLDDHSALMTFQLSRRPRGEQDRQVLATASSPTPDGHLRLTIAPEARERKDLWIVLEPAEHSLGLRLAEAGCADATQYVCGLSIRNLTSGITRTQTFEEEVHPSSRPYWGASISGTTGGGRMKLICTGFTFTSNNNFRWVWQLQRAGSSAWEPLTREEMVINVTPDPKDYCSTPALSTMTRGLSKALANYKYRCYIQDLLSSQGYPQYAAVFTVGSLDGEEDSELFFMVGGAMVGVFLFTAIITIGYRFILFPLRQEGLDKQKVPVPSAARAKPLTPVAPAVKGKKPLTPFYSAARKKPSTSVYSAAKKKPLTPVPPAVNGTKPLTPVPPAVNGTKPSTPVPPAVNGTNLSTPVPPAFGGPKPTAPEGGTSPTTPAPSAPEATCAAPAASPAVAECGVSAGSIKPETSAPRAATSEPPTTSASVSEDREWVPASPASGAQPSTRTAAEQKGSAGVRSGWV